MKQTIGKSDFRNAFREYGRESQFSYEALGMLFDYFEEMDSEMELDVIAICCDYAESDASELVDQFGIDVDDDADDDTIQDAVAEYLNENTYVIGQTGAGYFVYQQF